MPRSRYIVVDRSGSIAIARRRRRRCIIRLRRRGVHVSLFRWCRSPFARRRRGGNRRWRRGTRRCHVSRGFRATARRDGHLATTRRRLTIDVSTFSEMTIGVDARERRCYAAVARSERNERRTVRRFATTTRILNENAPDLNKILSHFHNNGGKRRHFIRYNHINDRFK